MSKKSYSWAVVGAGPAGILAIGKLLDQGIDPHSIVWLDPDFNVGDLGQYWFNVPSNTKVALFSQFLSSCKSFQYDFPKEHELNTTNPQETCLLKHMVKPLTQVTNTLINTVDNKSFTVTKLNLIDDLWHLKSYDQTLIAQNVILATGSEPKILEQTTHDTIPLAIALNPDKLKETVTPNDTVAVYGASHSAVLVIKNLLETGCKVTNFYKHSIRYAIPQKDYIIYDNTGLKGSAATWAKHHLHGQAIHNLTRSPLEADDAPALLAACNKAVYAIGFNQRNINIPGVSLSEYDPHTGIVAPRLFGLGVGFPELITSPLGHQEANVGLAKFVKYIDKVLPLWLQYTQ